MFLSSPGLSKCSLPRLDVYYESLCPYSRQFIREEVFPAYTALQQYFDVFFIAYGNADVRIVIIILLLSDYHLIVIWLLSDYHLVIIGSLSDDYLIIIISLSDYYLDHRRPRVRVHHILPAWGEGVCWECCAGLHSQVSARYVDTG